jgi:hypothetical protein
MILTPDHLLDQADGLLRRPVGGPHRQADLRRAISAAYYGVFHAILTAAADQVIGKGQRGTQRYALVYRSIDHRALNGLCNLVAHASLPPKYRVHEPAGGFNIAMKAFARFTGELQQERHAADYDPTHWAEATKTAAMIRSARDSIQTWNALPDDQREAFLLLLMFAPR